MRDVEKRVLSRDNTLIITRSRDLALQINNMLGFHKSSWLPCPAVLSSSQLDRDHGNKRIAAILQIPHGPQPISQSHFDDIRRYLAETQAEVDVIAFHEAECEYLARNFPDRRLRYSERAETYLSWFNQYGAVVSTRLHGALAAMSSGSWACIFQRDDFRVNSTAELVTPVHVLPPSSAIDAAIAALSSTSELQMEVYLFKQEVMLQYQQKLVPFMKTVRAF